MFAAENLAWFADQSLPRALSETMMRGSLRVLGGYSGHRRGEGEGHTEQVGKKAQIRNKNAHFCSELLRWSDPWCRSAEEHSGTGFLAMENWGHAFCNKFSVQSFSSCGQRSKRPGGSQKKAVGMTPTGAIVKMHGHDLLMHAGPASRFLVKIHDFDDDLSSRE